MHHFITKEFVPPEIYASEGDRAIGRIDPRMVEFIEKLRTDLDRPITINNWHLGKSFKYRGFRPEGCGVGVPGGQHYLGRALDFDVEGMSAMDVRLYILGRLDQYPQVTRMEDDVKWVHVDCKDIGDKKRIQLFKP